MIYEFALEPELVATWGNFHDYRYFIDKFGYGQPRFISRFPKGWQRRVWESSQGASQEDRKRLEALILCLSEKMIRRTGHHYDGGSWLENAEREDEHKSFRAILARVNPRNHATVIGMDVFEGIHSLWDAPDTIIIPRRANDMASALSSLLSISTRILFIDPHFGPENSRYRKPLQEFLRKATLARRAALPVIEVHAKVKASEEFFRAECHKLARIIPSGVAVKFVRWQQKENGQSLHNRYVLTDFGGVLFSHGLDEGRIGETDDITLLDRKSYERRWSEYTGINPAFDLAEEPFEIVGK